MIRNHSSKTRRRGATLVEFALVIGSVLFMLMAIYEYGLFLMVRNALDHAAREGARLAISTTNVKTTADIQNLAQTYLAGQRLGNLNIQAYWADTLGNNKGLWNDAPFGERIAVDITCTYSPLVPSLGFLPNPVAVRGKAIMRSEAN